MHQGLSQKLLAGNSAVGYMGTLATRFTLPLPSHRSPWPSTNFLLAAEAGNHAAGDCIAYRKRGYTAKAVLAFGRWPIVEGT